MTNRYILTGMFLMSTSCSTMNESLQLGAGLGAASGAAATYAAQTSSGHSASLENVALGAGIGIAAGLITSYFVHKKVDEDRKSQQSEFTDMYFGDLPPNPFIVPKTNNKKGVR